MTLVFNPKRSQNGVNMKSSNLRVKDGKRPETTFVVISRGFQLREVGK